MRQKPAEFSSGKWPNNVKFRCSPLGIEVREGDWGANRGSLTWEEIAVLARIPRYKLEAFIHEVHYEV